MARCDQGYLCRVCGLEVEYITDSTLYLRYVIGEIDPETLHLAPECHLQCYPVLAQFICDPRLGAVPEIDGPMARAHLDPEYVAQRIALISAGYQRLWDIRSSRHAFPTVQEYPLTQVIERWQQ